MRRLAISSRWQLSMTSIYSLNSRCGEAARTYLFKRSTGHILHYQLSRAKHRPASRLNAQQGLYHLEIGNWPWAISSGARSLPWNSETTKTNVGLQVPGNEGVRSTAKPHVKTGGLRLLERGTKAAECDHSAHQSCRSPNPGCVKAAADAGALKRAAPRRPPRRLLARGAPKGAASAVARSPSGHDAQETRRGEDARRSAESSAGPRGQPGSPTSRPAPARTRFCRCPSAEAPFSRTERPFWTAWTERNPCRERRDSHDSTFCERALEGLPSFSSAAFATLPTKPERTTACCAARTLPTTQHCSDGFDDDDDAARGQLRTPFYSTKLPPSPTSCKSGFQSLPRQRQLR